MESGKSSGSKPRTARVKQTTTPPRDDGKSLSPLSDDEYKRLAHFRYTLRHLARQTELEARKLGVTPQQYQLLLAIKGFPGRDWANISELAERLQIRHNAVIGLVNRAESRGFVVRRQDDDRPDRRIVHIHLTPAGEELLQVMASALHAERSRVRDSLDDLMNKMDP